MNDEGQLGADTVVHKLVRVWKKWLPRRDDESTFRRNDMNALISGRTPSLGTVYCVSLPRPWRRSTPHA